MPIQAYFYMNVTRANENKHITRTTTKILGSIDKSLNLQRTHQKRLNTLMQMTRNEAFQFFKIHLFLIQIYNMLQLIMKTPINYIKMNLYDVDYQLCTLH